MTTLAIVWLGCVAVLLELVHRAPIVEHLDDAASGLPAAARPYETR